MKTLKKYVLGLLMGAEYIVLRSGFSFSDECSLLILLAIISIVLIARRLLFGSARAISN
jgi:hypothetical protein